MAKEKTIKKFGNYLLIDGQMYEPIHVKGKRSSEYLKFKKIDKKELEKTVDEIAEFLAKEVESKEIIKNALYDTPTKFLKKLKKAVRGKKKPKVKKRYGCFDIIVGKETIPIR